jgi:hypothetical protein
MALMLVLVALLRVCTLPAVMSEDRRMAEVSYTLDTPISNGTYSDIYRFVYNYGAQNHFAPDSLSVINMTILNNGQGFINTPWAYQTPYEDDFSVVEFADHYVVTTAYFFMGELYRRVMVKDNAGVLLHDSLYRRSQPNILRYRRDYEYRPDGKVSTLHHYRNVSNGSYNGYWQFEMFYDEQGHKTEEVRHFSADSLSWNPVNQLLFLYESGDYIPASYQIDSYVADTFMTNFYAIPACSEVKIMGVAINTWESGLWLQYPGSIGFEYSYDEDDFLQVTSYGLYACPSEITTMIYSPRGQMVGHKYWYSGTGSQVHKTNYTWEHFGVANDDEYLAPAPRLAIRNYPNPFVQSTKISLKGQDSPISSVTLYNLRGQIVWQSNDLKSTEFIWDGKNQSGMPVSSGLYLVKVKSGSQTVTGKLIKTD